MALGKVKNPYDYFSDLDGNALEGGKIYIGTAGLDAETNPKAVYFDAAGTVPAAQPIRTADGYPTSGGAARDIYTAGDYSITVKTSDDTLIYSVTSGNQDGPYALDDVAAKSYTERNATNAEAGYALGDGVDWWMAGQHYLNDYDKTGTDSCLNDLGQDGVVPFGVATPEHYGAPAYPGDAAPAATRAHSNHAHVRYMGQYNLGGGVVFSSRVDDLYIDAKGALLENLATDETDCFTFNDMVINFRIEIGSLIGGADAGSNFVVGDLMAHGAFDITDHQTLATDKHLIKFVESETVQGDCGRFTNVDVGGKTWRVPEASTVAAVYKDSNFSTLNNVRFTVLQHFCSTHATLGQPFYLLLCRASSQYFSGIEFAKMGVEYCINGAVHIAGARSPEVGLIESYDIDHDGTGELQKDTVWFGEYDEYVSRFGYPSQGAGGTQPCFAPISKGVFRAGESTFAAGVVDIRFEDARDWRCEQFGAQTAARNVTIDCGPRAGIVYNPFNATLSNFDASLHTVIGDDEVSRFPALEVGGVVVDPTAPKVAAKGASSAAGALAAGYGVTSVSKTATGVYEITLDDAVTALNAALVATARQADRTVFVTQISTTVFEVKFRNLAGVATDTSFTFSVID